MENITKELLNNMLSDIDYATITSQDLTGLIGEYMRKVEVEKEYGEKIKLGKDGRWYIRIDGKMIRRSTREKVISAICTQQFSSNTIDNIAPDWLKSRLLSRSAGTFRRDVKYYEDYIKGTPLAQKEISLITLADGYEWTEWLLKKKPSMKKKYWKNIHSTLNSLLAFGGSRALVDLQIHRDRFARTSKKTSEQRIFFDEEKKTVKALAYEDAEKNTSCMPLGIPLIFCTGIRDGELCALHWRDIEGDYLHIQEEMVEATDIEGNFMGFKLVDHCKSDAGDRLIKISKETKHILHLCKLYNFSSGIPVGQDDFIFARKDKSGNVVPCTSRSFECRIKKYCKHAGMNELKSQHDARRTFATDCFYANMPLKNLQALLGHSSLKQTQDYIYTKPCDNVDEYLDAINL